MRYGYHWYLSLPVSSWLEIAVLPSDTSVPLRGSLFSNGVPRSLWFQTFQISPHPVYFQAVRLDFSVLQSSFTSYCCLNDSLTVSVYLSPAIQLPVQAPNSNQPPLNIPYPSSLQSPNSSSWLGRGYLLTGRRQEVGVGHRCRIGIPTLSKLLFMRA